MTRQLRRGLLGRDDDSLKSFQHLFQCGKLHRFEQIEVDPRARCRVLIVGIRKPRHGDDERRLAARPLTNASAYFEAIQLRKTDIQQDDIGRTLFTQGECGQSIRGDVHVMTRKTQ